MSGELSASAGRPTGLPQRPQWARGLDAPLHASTSKDGPSAGRGGSARGSARRSGSRSRSRERPTESRSPPRRDGYRDERYAPEPSRQWGASEGQQRPRDRASRSPEIHRSGTPDRYRSRSPRRQSYSSRPPSPPSSNQSRQFEPRDTLHRSTSTREDSRGSRSYGYDTEMRETSGLSSGHRPQEGADSGGRSPRRPSASPPRSRMPPPMPSPQGSYNTGRSQAVASDDSYRPQNSMYGPGGPSSSSVPVGPRLHQAALPPPHLPMDSSPAPTRPRPVTSYSTPTPAYADGDRAMPDAPPHVAYPSPAAIPTGPKGWSGGAGGAAPRQAGGTWAKGPMAAAVLSHQQSSPAVPFHRPSEASMPPQPSLPPTYTQDQAIAMSMTDTATVPSQQLLQTVGQQLAARQALIKQQLAQTAAANAPPSIPSGPRHSYSAPMVEQSSAVQTRKADEQRFELERARDAAVQHFSAGRWQNKGIVPKAVPVVGAEFAVEIARLRAHRVGVLLPEHYKVARATRSAMLVLLATTVETEISRIRF